MPPDSQKHTHTHINSRSLARTHLQPVVVVDRRAQHLQRQHTVLLDRAGLAALEPRQRLLQDRLYERVDDAESGCCE